jgi:pyruvate/2-oxoglutarate dehydrogenase complex dihydrolipoamide acyltransferase (E2) component
MSVIEVKVPDIGDFKNIPVIEVLVKPGDSVNREAPLVTLESDKATMEVPAPAAGRVKEIKVKVGDKVSEGSLVLLLESAGDGAAAKIPPSPSLQKGGDTTPPSSPLPKGEGEIPPSPPLPKGGSEIPPSPPLA